MNTEKLSVRLETVANHIPEGYTLADIGSDHAYLPCHLVKKGAVPAAIAGEVAEGPYQSALKQVQYEGLTDKIKVRKGDGLEVVEPGEADCISIAGMGGALIASILENGKAKVAGVKKLVLQPNIGSSAVRSWLIDNGWELVAEEIIKEDGKIYEILAAEKGSPLSAYSDRMKRDILFGPFLLKDRNPVFLEKWQSEKANWERILKSLESAGKNDETVQKRNELSEKIQMAEEILQQ
ncbi:tRNA (adenine(22)-N(1))-methyltransferase [Bacillus sp. T33-2]|uniref:tRNA (adenine(22)-N(1))-methyltransferase n=1 Tax=Bacillus sp. T33-2 TaxID=2054168 RepID=UPI000C757B89|nr:tRNA (adenine(22)-N(1))-methyltransferase TrmK [Bacillus sp. T33-2]PLR93837.1 tRNA (adenine(22)-N(1))-methyltransferase TrmK [Bacillus sp. T33-2]